MDSSSSVQHRQLVVSQAAETLLENNVTEQLVSDVEENVYTKLHHYSFKKLKKRWVRSAIRIYVENDNILNHMYPHWRNKTKNYPASRMKKLPYDWERLKRRMEKRALD